MGELGNMGNSGALTPLAAARGAPSAETFTIYAAFARVSVFSRGLDVDADFGKASLGLAGALV
jgi:hypothetical protein